MKKDKKMEKARSPAYIMSRSLGNCYPETEYLLIHLDIGLELPVP